MAMLCARCGLQIVHEKRDFNLCLDCLIELLIEQSSLEIPSHYDATRFELRMTKRGLCHKCGGKKRKFRLFAYCQCERNQFGDRYVNEFGQLTMTGWNEILTPEECEEAMYVHGTTAIEGNTLDMEDTCEILFGDVKTVIDKYGWTDMTPEKVKKILEEQEVRDD